MRSGAVEKRLAENADASPVLAVAYKAKGGLKTALYISYLTHPACLTGMSSDQWWFIGTFIDASLAAMSSADVSRRLATSLSISAMRPFLSM